MLVVWLIFGVLFLDKKCGNFVEFVILLVVVYLCVVVCIGIC